MSVIDCKLWSIKWHNKPIVNSLATKYSSRNIPFIFNRSETKSHSGWYCCVQNEEFKIRKNLSIIQRLALGQPILLGGIFVKFRSSAQLNLERCFEPKKPVNYALSLVDVGLVTSL
jgi:hypothetical protein